MSSSRTDGRGHWPAGKARSAARPAERRRALARVRRAARTWSVREIARQLDVSDRTVRRWLAGADRPSAASCRRALDRL